MIEKSRRSAVVSRREILKTAAASTCALAAPSIVQAQSNLALPIGMNLAGIADWEPGFPFLNLLWGSRNWGTRDITGAGNWNSDQMDHVELDPDGYPLELPVRPPGSANAHVVFTLLPNVATPGNYVVLFDGEGQITFGGGSRIQQERPGRLVISMRHTGGDLVEELVIRRSRRGNHIRNIRIVPIAHEHTDLMKNPFRPEAVEFCRPWHCLRYINWQGITDSIHQRWSERKRRSFYTQTGVGGDVLDFTGNPLPMWQRKWGSGMALDLCIDMANIVRNDAWICVPHLADDECITEMAKFVKQRLDPSLKIYLEYSNELWNWQFGQAQWMLSSELAGDLVAAAGYPPPWKTRTKPTQFRNGVMVRGAGDGVDHPYRIAALFRRCFKLWEDVFTGADRKRLVRVCSIQASWPDTANRTLNWVMRHGGCDALSPTGYFGPNQDVYKRWEEAGARLTADHVIADMKQMIAEERRLILEIAGFARRAGVRLVVYEGGQHIQSLGQVDKPYSPALGTAQKHPGMYDLYRANIDEYVRAGCDLFMAFASVTRQGSRWGSWGHAEYYGQDPNEMPKYKAILDANTPRSQ